MGALINITVNLFFTLSTGILLFINNRYFASVFGAEKLGLINLFTQMIQYLNLVDLGIASASAYALYEPLAKKNKEKINIIMSTISNFYRKIVISIIIFGSISGLFLSFLIGKDTYEGIYYIYWLIYVINLALNYSFIKYTVLFNADQKYSKTRKIQGTFRLLTLCLQLFILINKGSLFFFLFIMVFENILSGLFYLKIFKKEYSWIKKVTEIDEDIKDNMKKLFWHKISGLVVSNTDYIILTKFTGLAIVGKYSSHLMVISMLKVIFTIIQPAISPVIGKFIAINSKEVIYEKWKQIVFIYLLLGTVVFVGGLGLLSDFIYLWMGKEYQLSSTVVFFIMLNLLMMILNMAVMLFKTNSGYYNDVYNPILEATLNLVISIILVQKMGLIGVVLGTTISSLVVLIISKPVLVYRNCFNRGWDIYLKDFLGFILLVFMGSFINIKILEIILEVLIIDSWKKFIIGSLIASFSTFILSGVIFSVNKDFRKLIREAFIFFQMLKSK